MGISLLFHVGIIISMILKYYWINLKNEFEELKSWIFLVLNEPCECTDCQCSVSWERVWYCLWMEGENASKNISWEYFNTFKNQSISFSDPPSVFLFCFWVIIQHSRFRIPCKYVDWELFACIYLLILI